MEPDKIRNLTDEELSNQQAKSAEQLFRIRFQKSLGNNEGVKKLRVLKLDIARIQTIVRERELAAAKVAAPAIVAIVAVAPAASTRTARKKAKKG